MDHTKDEYMQDQKAQAIMRVFAPTNDSSIIFLLFGKRHNTNTMFGWVKRERKCNSPLFGWSEKGRGNKMGQIEFFTLSHHLFSFQIGEKRGEKMVMRRK